MSSATVPYRRQLTLFVPPPTATPIEAVRRTVDPVQHALIAAHVTLAREDELAGVDLTMLAARLAAPAARAPTLGFGAAERFDGHGILLPCVTGEPAFAALRLHLLAAPSIRRHAPHLTLAHPRNPRAAGNELAAAAALAAPMTIAFDAACLIEQRAGGPWQLVATFALAR